MELDKISEHIVVRLDQIEEATASDLRDALGLDQNQSVHYRMDEKLIPQGLAHEAPERREQPGSRKAARVYQITDKGRTWVEEHGHKVTLTDIDDAEQEIQRLSATVRDLSTDVQNLKRWRQEQAGHSGGVSTRLSTLGDRVDDLDERLDRHDRRDYSGIWDDLHDLDSRLSRLEEKISDREVATTDDVTDATAEVDVRDRVDSLDTRISGLEESLEDYSDWAHSVQPRIDEAYQRATKSLIDRLIPWR